MLFATVALAAAFRYRARARLRELDQAKLIERERLARERLARDLHDTVAHHVSAMAIRAQAGLAMMPSRPDAAAEALQLIEAEAARALDEMLAMVRVLRRDERADLAPNPRIADLAKLASRARPSVDVAVSGDLDDLLPSIGSAVYRLAQESVTNARRHARHVTRIEVRVTADDTSVRLRVSDDGDPGLVRPAASPGYGLVGMIERADLLGGTCAAGPGPGRGWTVTAVLPPWRGAGMSVRVIVADDQEIVRTGLTMMLDSQPGIEVVGEAADGVAAVGLARRLRPDVCLFDIRMPGTDGIEATRRLAGPGVEDPLAVVVITTFDLDEYVYAALRAGARGFLLKNAGTQLLAQAVHAAATGDALIAPSITARLLDAFAGTGSTAPSQPVDPLTEREEQVLLSVARERTNREIAEELYITLSTVKTHVASLMAKIGARNRVEIAIWAYETRRVRDAPGRRKY